MLSAASAFSLEQQVGLADGVGFGVDLLAVEVGRDILAVLGGELPQGVLGHRQHAAGAAGAIVEQVGAGLDILGDGEEDEPGHESYGVTRRPVLAGFFVVLLVEAPHQLFEDRAHAVVVEAGMADRTVGVPHRDRAEVDVGGGEFLDQRAEGVGPGQARDLIAELKIVEDVLDIGREAVEIGFEVGGQLLAAGAGAQVAQGEPGGVVEGLAGGLSQGRVLFNDAGGIESRLHVKDGLLAVFQHCVEPPQYSHRQYDVAVFAAYVEVAQDVVGDAPDVIGNPAQITVIQHKVPVRYWLHPAASASYDDAGLRRVLVLVKCGNDRLGHAACQSA